MSKFKNKDELFSHREQAIGKLNSYIEKLILSDNPRDKGKADKLCYWLQDWQTFLDFEEGFTSMSLRRYKRGEVIKVHLGFNVGSEEGGLHYAVVLDKNNAKSSPVLSIVPLSSVKPHTDILKLKNGSIFLGNELFTNLNSKISILERNVKSNIDELQKLIDELDDSNAVEKMKIINPKLEAAEKEIVFLDKVRNEVMKMKQGSIALVNQITTISKIRIYDPKTDHDILSGIKFSNEKLDMIDAEIRKKSTNL